MLSYAESATAITTQLAPVGSTFTVTGEGTDTVTTHQPFQLWGSDQADSLTGSPGDDRILGMGGDDVVDGGAGNDVLRGEDDCTLSCDPAPDHDVVVGGEGDDDLGSGAGRDDFDAGPGDDFVSAGSRLGVGTVIGGAGADTLHVFLQTADLRGHVDGGADVDLLRVIALRPLEPGTRVVVDAVEGRLRAGGLGELITFAGIEAYGLSANDAGTERRPLLFRFLGSEAGERVSVTPYGESMLHARMGGGDDVVRGTPRDDVIDAGTGRDVVRAFRGEDVCRSAEEAHGCEVQR
jgi:Ca2+-binding RTX toxin-like protein